MTYQGTSCDQLDFVAAVSFFVVVEEGLLHNVDALSFYWLYPFGVRKEWVALEVDTNPVNDPGCSSENKKSYLMFEIIAIMIMI